MLELLKKAQWIWPCRNMYLQNCYAGFRYDFELPSTPEKAPLYITADQIYRLYVNGQYICRGPVRGHQTSWPVDCVDIRHALRNGHNFISIEAHNPGISTFAYTHRDTAGLLVAASWDNGTEIYSGTGKWTIFRNTAYPSNTGRLSLQMGWQEALDLQKDNRSWIYDDTPAQLPIQPKWVIHRIDKTIYGSLPWTATEERGIPQLDEHLTAPVAVKREGFGSVSPNHADGENIAWTFGDDEAPTVEWKNAETFSVDGDAMAGVIPATKEGQLFAAIFDLGDGWLPGVPVIDFDHTEAGTVVEFHYHHTLPHGVPELIPPSGVGSQQGFASRVILDNAEHRHMELFHTMGTRFFTLVVRGNSKPLPARLRWRTAVYPLNITASFSSDDALVNDIYRICRQTQRVCSLDTFVDTPWREQSQWWGDARVQAKNTFFLTGDTRLLSHGIHSIAGQKAPDGLTFADAPTTGCGCVLPDFCLTWIATLYDLYFQTGSTEHLKEHRAQAESILAYFERQRNANGLIQYDNRYWLFEDWCTIPKEPIPAFLNLWHCYVLSLYEKLLAANGDDTAAIKAQLNTERQTIKSAFLDRETGLIRPIINKDGQPDGIPAVHDQVLAMLLDLAPECSRQMIEKRILPCLKGTLKEGAVPSSFWATYLLDLAQILGLNKEALEYVKHGWEPMIPCGTAWEIFSDADNGCFSYSHAWSAHLVSHFPEMLCGIIQSEPAWKAIKFMPPADIPLNNIQTAIPTPYGIMKAAWERQSDGRIAYSLELPAGITAAVRLPGDTAETTVTGIWQAIR